MLSAHLLHQVCLLLPWMEPGWPKRAALQGRLVLTHSGLKPLPWLQLLMAGWWSAHVLRFSVLDPPAEWTRYPPCVVALRQCQGLRTYLQFLGLRGAAGGLKPATLLRLCEAAVVSACAIATRWARSQQAGGCVCACMRSADC